MAISKSKANEYSEKYYEDIYKFCCSKCRNAESACDITQDTFVIFLNNCHKIDESAVRAYLYKIASNKLHEYFRSVQRQNSYVDLDECDFIECEDTYHLDDEDDESDRCLSQEEFEERLNETQKKILNILSPKEKELFYKLYVEKKSIKLVVQETGDSEGNVRIKSYRIRKKAKEAILTTKLFLLVITFKMFG